MSGVPPTGPPSAAAPPAAKPAAPAEPGASAPASSGSSAGPLSAARKALCGARKAVCDMDEPTKKKVGAAGVAVLAVVLGLLCRSSCSEEEPEEKGAAEAVKELAGDVKESVGGVLEAIGKGLDGLLTKGSGGSHSDSSSSRSVVSSRGGGLKDLPGDFLRSQHS